MSLARAASRTFNFASRGFAFLANRIWISSAEQRVRPWREINGDRTLRLNYDLGPDSIVFDIGGFEGQWASDLFAMYACHLHVFEPVPQYVERIRARFARNPKVHVHPFGLARSSTRTTIRVDGDASSIHAGLHGSGDLEIELRSAVDFIRESRIEKIDLMKINIEGGEYELLESLLAAGLTRGIANIQVQFHDFIPDASARMERIQKALTATHSLTYQYRFVWENWRRNG